MLQAMINQPRSRFALSCAAISAGSAVCLLALYLYRAQYVWEMHRTADEIQDLTGRSLLDLRLEPQAHYFVWWEETRIPKDVPAARRKLVDEMKARITECENILAEEHSLLKYLDDLVERYPELKKEQGDAEKVTVDGKTFTDEELMAYIDATGNQILDQNERTVKILDENMQNLYQFLQQYNLRETHRPQAPEFGYFDRQMFAHECVLDYESRCALVGTIPKSVGDRIPPTGRIEEADYVAAFRLIVDWNGEPYDFLKYTQGYQSGVPRFSGHNDAFDALLWLVQKKTIPVPSQLDEGVHDELRRRFPGTFGWPPQIFRLDRVPFSESVTVARFAVLRYANGELGPISEATAASLVQHLRTQQQLLQRNYSRLPLIVLVLPLLASLLCFFWARHALKGAKP